MTEVRICALDRKAEAEFTCREVASGASGPEHALRATRSLTGQELSPKGRRRYLEIAASQGVSNR